MYKYIYIHIYRNIIYVFIYIYVYVLDDFNPQHFHSHQLQEYIAPVGAAIWSCSMEEALIESRTGEN